MDTAILSSFDKYTTFSFGNTTPPTPRANICPMPIWSLSSNCSTYSMASPIVGKKLMMPSSAECSRQTAQKSVCPP